MQFEIFYYKSKYGIYDFYYFSLKERKKFGNMWFLLKAVTIHASKKTGFDYKNNYKDSKLAYFWLIDNLAKSILYYQQLDYILHQG